MGRNFLMKRTQYVITAFIGLLTLQLIVIGECSTEWSPTLSVSTFNWKATVNQLRDNNLYNDINFLGSINLPGGGIRVHLQSKPPDNFNFFKGDRLNFSIVVEGDMVINVDKYESDYHLLILPTEINGTGFFEILFEQTELLENLTQSVLIDSSISTDIAFLSLKYNNSLDINYEWNIITGLLTRKSVISPSGLKLIVILGVGSGFYFIPTYYLGWIYSSIFISVLIIIGKNLKIKVPDDISTD